MRPFPLFVAWQALKHGAALWYGIVTPFSMWLIVVYAIAAAIFFPWVHGRVARVVVGSLLVIDGLLPLLQTAWTHWLGLAVSTGWLAAWLLEGKPQRISGDSARGRSKGLAKESPTETGSAKAGRHLLLIKENHFVKGLVLENPLGSQIQKCGTIRLFGKRFCEQPWICAWREVISKEDGRFAGVCFVDFCDEDAEPLRRDLAAENVIAADDGFVALLREVRDWEVQPGPYLPAEHFQADDGGSCYLLINAFGVGEELPGGLRRVSSMTEIAEASQ